MRFFRTLYNNFNKSINKITVQPPVRPVMAIGSVYVAYDDLIAISDNNIVNSRQNINKYKDNDDNDHSLIKTILFSMSSFDW